MYKRQAYDSDLKKLPGIGDARAKAILREFRTKKRILEATPQELADAAKLSPEKSEEVWRGIHELWGEAPTELSLIHI